jgi:amidase
MLRRDVLRMTGFAGGALVLGGCGRGAEGLDAYADYGELGALRETGEWSAEAITKACLERIRRLDGAGLGVRAVLEVNLEAEATAAERDRAVSAGPLHGLPILIKDNIETADGMQTTAGSWALAGARVAEDAWVAKRLREAGMVLLGKTNLSEWANFRSPKSTSGWSGRGGLTRNPHRLTHSASGSSSGSAAAVAAGYAPGAVGTETNGSIVSPASACGIVGLKPTLGLISRRGIIPITGWQDTAGPMTRTVRDAALLLNVLAGADGRDERTAEAGERRAADYTAGLGEGALRGRRLGVARGWAGENAGVLRVFEEALGLLREAGAEVVEGVEVPGTGTMGRLSLMAMLVEFRADLNGYLAGRGGGVGSLAELIAFNEANREREMPHFGQEFFEQAERMGTVEMVAAGAEARDEARRLAGREGIDAVLRRHDLDALVCPTNDPAGEIDLGGGDGPGRVASTPSAVAGYPHLTVPMGMAGGLPVGLSFLGPAWSEGELLAMGHAYERARGWRAGWPEGMAEWEKE